MAPFFFLRAPEGLKAIALMKLEWPGSEWRISPERADQISSVLPSSASEATWDRREVQRLVGTQETGMLFSSLLTKWRPQQYDRHSAAGASAPPAECRAFGRIAGHTAK